MTRRAVIAIAAACWVALFAGIALIALDPKQGWIGVSVIMAALIIGSAALACLRKGQR